MKVCTDACLFGAIVANELQQLTAKNILDIGTGTGLLSLMLAQKTTAVIDAVEIETAAFAQAQENMAQSPWNKTIDVFNCAIQQFKSNKKYDAIISNPPFFENDLKPIAKNKNFAKHEAALTFIELLNAVVTHLSDTGFFAALLPYHRSSYFIEESNKLSLHLKKNIKVRQTNKHQYFRAILIFSKEEATTQQTELTIKNEAGNYANEFIALLKDYYLYL